MKVMIEIKNVPQKNDVLIFDGNQFECINKNMFFQDLIEENFRVKDELRIINEKLIELSNEIKYLKGE